MSMNASAKRVTQLRDEADLGIYEATRLAEAEKRFDVLNQAHRSGDLEAKIDALMKCALSDARRALQNAQSALPPAMRRNIS